MFQTLMEKEAAQAPDIIQQQLIANQLLVEKVGQKLREFAPKMVMMIGRGSSDHAGVFGKYLIEIEAGIPVSSAAPSIASVYGKSLNLKDALVIVISQSGRSPDIIAQAEMAKKSGAYCIALVNDESSPLRDIVDEIIPLKAGNEMSVAATKSYLATLSALVHIVANWTQNQPLIAALNELPTAMKTMVESPVQLTPSALEGVKNMVVLARGLGFSIAKEMALKLKEVCAIHAESFSSAEFLHGPVTLVEQGLVILNCAVADETASSHQLQINEVGQRGAQLVQLNQNNITIHPRLAPFLVLQRFYLDVAKVALSRGFNPDEPKGLKKVTRTL
ncbi:glucosamine--fructose-6-phosphate aminotransferase (isomerizing) [Pseudoalteromonas translucida KMM 520]|uniref:Glucosamine--fructose-6-phosphate aminotransferase (Isomerizing) n=1 Tax=Pseudoalteromonas translucida KMM 520 TaxID=1315283 RepID=A0A0U2VAA0_9GAMM|nr:SIS domain-containing protein [Pseudoalteromonas translucida]ALS34653.1 glucosamine--fructose-6-phosphate aminotransferase (isomerizing) [Pseudoalteromonas translucida KMM 520]